MKGLGACVVKIHGGNPPEGVLDFSSPLNPLGPPRLLLNVLFNEIEGGAVSRYPDPSYSDFKNSVSMFYNIDPENILPLNGAAEGLYMLLAVLKPRRLIVYEPTFGDHWEASRSLGIDIVALPLISEGNRYVLEPDLLCNIPEREKENSLVLLSNPNNPTGVLVRSRKIKSLYSCLGNGSYIVIDEAFMDFTTGSESFMGKGFERTIVIRSFTKILSIPGLRIGFLYSEDRDLLSRLEGFRQPWNINILAERAVSFMLRSIDIFRDFIRESRDFVKNEREWLYKKLKSLGLTVYRSWGPFLLVRHSGYTHPELQSALIDNGIYVRDASSFHGLSGEYSRVSVKLRKDNAILVEVFRKLFGG